MTDTKYATPDESPAVVVSHDDDDDSPDHEWAVTLTDESRHRLLGFNDPRLEAHYVAYAHNTPAAVLATNAAIAVTLLWTALEHPWAEAGWGYRVVYAYAVAEFLLAAVIAVMWHCIHAQKTLLAKSQRRHSHSHGAHGHHHHDDDDDDDVGGEDDVERGLVNGRRSTLTGAEERPEY